MGSLEGLNVVNVYNRFDRNKKFKGILFRADEPSQSAELNEIQSLFVDEHRQLIQSIFGEGRIFKGGACYFSPGSQETTHITTTSANNISPGSYFTFSTTENDYAVYYIKNAVGDEPTLLGVITIPVQIVSTDNSTTVAEKTVTALLGITEATITQYYNKIIIQNDTIGNVTNARYGEPNPYFQIDVTVQGTLISAIFDATVFYAFDFTNDIPKRQIDIDIGENVKVGIAIAQQIVTEIDDPSLLNPAEGTINEGLPGAFRYKLEGRWCKETEVIAGETFFEVYDIVDGILIQPELRSPEIESTINLVGEFDYDANGSYVNSGFNISFDQNISSVEAGPLDLHQMTISEGVAHVDGRRLQYNYSRKFTIPFIGESEVDTINNESIIFNKDGWYELNYSPFKDITEVNGITEVAYEAKTRSAGTLFDILNYSPATSIILVSSTSGGSASYTLGTHYRLAGNQIEWIGATKPSDGTTYYITYRYNRLVTIDEDKLDRATNKIYLSGFVVGERVDVDYSFYLTRIDRINLLSTGEIDVSPGEASYYSPIPPKYAVGLSLGTCIVKYGLEPEVNMSYFRAFKMEDVQLMFQEIDNLRFNVARLAQMENLNKTDPATNKINSFTDPFIDDDLRDLGLTQRALVTNGLLIPGFDLNQTILKADSQPITLDYTEYLDINQWRFTGNRQVNEFMWRDPPPLQVTVSPAVYSWVAESIVKTIVKQNVLNESKGKTWHGGFRFDHAFWYRPVSSSTSVIASSISETTKVYTVPTIDITVSANRFNANEGAVITFDGVQLPGTYQANSEGYLNSTFSLPAGTKSGSKLIQVRGVQGNQRGENTFTAIPLIENITKLVENNVVKVLEDPVAEVFTLPLDTYITSASIQVTTLPNEYVDLYILPTSVGFPDRFNGLAVKRLYRSQLTVSTESSTLAGRTFIWNKFNFDHPVFIEGGVEYAIVVSCTDPNCRVRFARIGGYELTQNKWQTTQAYPQGVLLTSSTGSSWLPIHTDDLTFQLRTARFTGALSGGYYGKTVDFGTINVSNCTDLFLSTSYSAMPNTIVKYYITLLDRPLSTPLEIKPLSFFQIPTTGSNVRYTGRVKLTAELKTAQANTRLSPKISNICNLTWGTVVLPSEYISRSFPISGATHIKANIELYEPYPGSTYLYFYTTNTCMMTLNRSITGGVSTAQVVTAIALADEYYDGGEYFKIHSPVGSYYIWFTKNGLGRDPRSHNDVADDLVGYTSIVVPIVQEDTAVMVANEIVSKINSIVGSPFTASNSGTSTVTITCNSVGACDTISTGAGWRRLVRNGVTTLIQNNIVDVQFQGTSVSGFNLCSGLTDTRIKVVLSNNTYNDRPFAANLRAYFYAM